jgi:hypothetical protein
VCPPGFAEIALALAERHRVVPLLAAGAPPDLRAALRPRRLALAQSAVRLEAELARLSGLLANAGVPFLLLKGPGLARQAYSAPELRACDDLDLWVGARDFEPALAALFAAGYRRMEPLAARTASCARRAGIEAGLIHPERRRLVEVAHGVRALAPTPRAAREVLGAAAELAIGGAAVRVPAPAHAVLLACLHGAHHCWDRLGWVADVAGLWTRLAPAERAAACAAARRWRVETALGLGLRLAQTHFDLELEGRAAALAAAPRAAALAARAGLERIGRESPRAGMIARLRFERDAQDTAARRLATLAAWIFRPTLGDIEAVPLPPALAPLYAALRPLRLLRHPWLLRVSGRPG